MAPCTLSFPDGSSWLLNAYDEKAVADLRHLGRIMQLSNRPVSPGQTILFCGDAPHAAPNIEACVLSHVDNIDSTGVALMHLTRIVGRDVLRRGGLLLHGALAEWLGMGVILAAPGGTGKTTASNRLPSHWQMRSDDTTLAVRDGRGEYWAHPWPTLSRFMWGSPGGTWAVERGIPLAGIFFLRQAGEDRLEPVGDAQAAGMLVESAEQAVLLEWPEASAEENRQLRVQRFNSSCSLARAVPSCILHLSRYGAFWQKIEQVLRQERAGIA